MFYWLRIKVKPYLSDKLRVVGLTMTINVQQYEYVKQAGDTAGIIIGILPQYQMPFPEDDGVMISPGHATSIGIVQVLWKCQGLLNIVIFAR